VIAGIYEKNLVVNCLIMATCRRDPPGIGRWESLKLLRKHDSNYLKVYTQLKDRFGDVCSLYLPGLRYLVNHPDQVRHVLKDNHQNYVKSADYDELKPMVGDGLLNSEGELWKRQRRLIAGEFTHEKIKQQGDNIVGVAEKMVDRWRKRARAGESFDIASEMMTLTFEVAGNAFFGSELEPHSVVVGRAFGEASEASTLRMITLFKLPMAFPTRVNRRYRKSIETLDRVIYGIISNRRNSLTDRGDLLSRLLKASDSDGAPITPKLLRDELMTFMLAGHETTSVALMWTFYLLSRHPQVHGKLREEIAGVLGGRPSGADDLPRLPYNRAILQESMRLYPPVAAISRTPLHDDEVGAFTLRAGTYVSCVAGIVHKDARFWDRPAEFRPERFLPENQNNIYPFSYFPFGAGPRVCVGEHFALMEAQLILATLAPHFNIEVAPANEPIPDPLVTQRSKNGLLARVTEIRA
jgi:cytochrome P450